jgi:hypothetical protein
MQRGRRRWRRGPGPALGAVVAALAGACAAAACSLTGLDTDDGALDSADASVTDAAARLDADAARRDATGEPGDATVDAADADADLDTGPSTPACPTIAAGQSVCDDSPRHAIAVIHCAEGGPLYSPDFYFCYSSDDCVKGSLCVDEGFCKPTCTKSAQCADNDAAASYGAVSCNPVSLDAALIDP